MTDPMGDASVRPYEPFPSFARWSSSTRVSAVVDRFQEQFKALRAQSHDGGAALRERATRWAAIDTGAIEGLYDVDRGFTISVAASTALLQAIRRVKGESVERAVADALAAYELVLDLATTEALVTEAAIRELHSIVCRSQGTYRVYTAVGPQDQPLPKGVYKSQENYPLNLASNEVHSSAPVTDTSAEMARLVAELRSAAFRDAPPVQQAAFAHYAFVAVHPFADGNGRVARALASIYLYRRPGLPLVVFDDEKLQYLAALEAADDGDYQPLVSFVGERLIDTVNLLKGPQGLNLPSAADRVAVLTRELNGRSGLSHREVDGGAGRLLDAFERALRAAVRNAGLAPPLSGAVDRVLAGRIDPPTGFRPGPSETQLVLYLQSAAPTATALQSAFTVSVATGLGGDEDYVLHAASGERLGVFLREVLPRVATTLELRLGDFADGLLRTALAQLGEDARNALKANGYP